MKKFFKKLNLTRRDLYYLLAVLLFFGICFFMAFTKSGKIYNKDYYQRIYKYIVDDFVIALKRHINYREFEEKKRSQTGGYRGDINRYK